MKSCLNRLIGRCHNECQRDYNTKHHPNNYDYADYREVTVMEFGVKDKEKEVVVESPVRKFIPKVLNPSLESEDLLKKVM